MSRLKFILQVARPYRGRLLVAVLLTMLNTVGSLVPPLALRYLVDKVVTPGRWSIFPFIIGVIAFVPIWNAFVAAANRIIIGAIGQLMVVDIRTSLYRHLLGLSMRFHSQKGAGLIMSRLMTDVGMVQNFITGQTLGIVSNIVTLIFSIVMVIYLNWKLLPLLFFMMLLYAFNYHRFSQQIRNANLELREIMDQVSGRLQERLAGVRLVKTYCREHDETGAFLSSIEQVLSNGFRGDMLSASLSVYARLISGIGSTIIIFLSGWFVLHGMMTYGSLLACQTYVWQAVMVAVNLTLVAGTLTQSIVSLDRVIELTRYQPEIVEKPTAVDLKESTGDIHIDDVTFAYEPNKVLFNNLTHHIPAGKMTALVGHTGCGKTTITSLIMRLWDVQGGRVTLDGIDVRDLTLRSLHRHVGVVLQQPVIFEGTAFENIAYGMPEATQQDVEEAARAAQIHELIASLPDGYQSWFGKDGVKLSVGEKQRISIARAIIRKPAVLILDEATSSLDSESEFAIQEALRTVLHGRTSIVVAHRLSTIVEADQIVVMDEGKIIEIGTHETLMKVNGGRYRQLYEELQGKHGVNV
ncbi:MAG TPA: ABC transporter ATP-binding protein [Armatimonadota bacterium]|nr:ABC transporter ATP-binding protein [Armatimonadota bacterium]